MCGDDPTRRDVLLGAAVMGLAGLLGRSRSAHATPLAEVPPVMVAPSLAIMPRDSWGADLPPRGPITGEDVRFLLVHHTATAGAPTAGGTPAVLRSVYSFQTGPAKGWPDVCYQFFIDRDGVVWEGRAGALDAAVRADATGGSQGFAQLVCLVGDFTSSLPSEAAQVSLVKVLAWLADREQLDTSPGATATFVSRGSQRWAAGRTVTTSVIAPHRAMSYTACPGAAFAPVVERELQAQVHAARRTTAAPTPAGSGLVPASRGIRRLVRG
jgi:hypothetical protein